VQVGAVINGTHSGRRSDTEITLFDGTGVGLQDLAVADAIVKRGAMRISRLISEGP
jgi:alanine dehydrogenase